jgi:hypothetical protein
VFHDLRKAYALPAGVLVRCVPAPFPPIRETWLRAYTDRPADEPQVLTWQGDRLIQYHRLPRATDGLPLRELLVLLFGVPTWNVVDEQNLLAGHKVMADFVTRTDDWDEAKAIDQLGAALRRDLKVPVKLSLRQVERPHVVASGSFQQPVLPGTRLVLPVAVYGQEPPPPGTPQRAVSHDELLLAVGDYVGLAVIDDGVDTDGRWRFAGRGGRGQFRDQFPGRAGGFEAGDAPRVLVPGRIRVQQSNEPPRMHIVVRGDRKSEGVNAEAVLRRVAEQTGLTLRVERRRAPAVVVEKAE